MSQNNQGKSQLRNGNVVGVGLSKPETFSGPIPHPAIIEKYESIYPGAAKIIFENWDKQVDHRQKLEKSVVYFDNFKSLFGTIAGFLIQIIAVGGGIYTIIQGFIIAGLISIFVGMSMLAVAFFTNRQKKDLPKKD